MLLRLFLIAVRLRLHVQQSANRALKYGFFVRHDLTGFQTQ
jgi:hypothetical protein